MSVTATLSSTLQTYYAKPLMIQAVGKDEYDWMQSDQFRELTAKAQAESPGKNIFDKRTRAYRYYSRYEASYRKKYKSVLQKA